MNKKMFLIIIFSFFGLYFTSLSYSLNEKVQVYSNTQMGLEFKFPLTWEIEEDTTNDNDCNPFCSVSFRIPSDVIIPVSVRSYNLNDPSIQSECICNTLKEFVKWAYNFEPITSTIAFNGEVIYDNPISINNNISGREMESKFKGMGLRQSYYFWTLQNDIGYFISYTADQGIQYEKYLKEVKNMINSITLLPIDIPKKNIPSFLQ